MPDEAVCIAMHPCPVGRKWNYRKRRSIHDGTWPRETLIACLSSVNLRRGPLVAASRRFLQWR